jgi:hypothetical protein
MSRLDSTRIFLSKRIKTKVLLVAVVAMMSYHEHIVVVLVAR